VATYSGDVSDSGQRSPALEPGGGRHLNHHHRDFIRLASVRRTNRYVHRRRNSISGAIPNGETVTFYDGAVSMGTGDTKNGAATLATSALAVGTHSITATYAGDATYLTSTSKVFKQVVSLNASVTTLVSSANPSVYGQSVTLTATVAPASGSRCPTGKVTFKNGAPRSPRSSLVNGSAAYTTSTLAAGSLPLTASYWRRR
jgi:hypothetical protein